MLAQAAMPVVFVPGEFISQGSRTKCPVDGRENT
jgi:hypothetical protein